VFGYFAPPERYFLHGKRTENAKTHKNRSKVQNYLIKSIFFFSKPHSDFDFKTADQLGSIFQLKS